MAHQAHHYVPQVYLKGFFDPQRVANGVNSLWRYRPGGHPEEKGTKKIAEQTNFYDLPELDPTENDIEQMFSEIERTVAWDLKKLRSGKIALKQQEKAHLAGYFALQYTRTPWFRELANKSAITLQRAGLRYFFEKPGELEKFIGEIGGEINVESLKAYMARVLNGEIPMIQRNKAWNAKIMLEHADALGRVFFPMRWNLLEAARGSTFITSDNPLHIVDPVAAKLSPEGFKFSKELEFDIPLSPQFMLVGDRQCGPDRRLVVTPDSVKRANAMHMTRAEELYASFNSKELQAEFDEAVKTRPPSIRDLPEEYLRATVERAHEGVTGNG